jgi:hypothetical protein
MALRERGSVAATASIRARHPVLLNVQDIGGNAKPYQVRQLLAIIERKEQCVANI